jgi:MYXO-CTERM domain-containing protein
MPRSLPFLSRRLSPLALSLGVVSAWLTVGSVARAGTLTVGPSGSYALPCQAIAAAKAGDVVEIAAGSYVDACKIGVSITLRGVGGRPVITAPSPIPNQKGLFAIEGSDTDVIVENLELRGAKVPDENGAAIRAQGRNLTVTSCVLKDNENGVLGGEGGVITIENTVLDSNGDGKGYAHNAYIGTAKKLIFRGNYSRAAKSGHLLKSRADENIVLANRLTGEDGTESYEADFPNGGTVVFAYNLIEQGTTTENPNLLAYGEEGLPKPNNTLAVVFNTFVNNRGKGNETYVLVGAAMKGQVAIFDNIFQGGGKITGFAAALTGGNFEGDASLVNVAGYDFHLQEGSKARDLGVDASAYLAGNPLLAYVHPTSFVTRTTIGSAPDAGAYEWGATEVGGAGGAGTGGMATAGAGGTATAGAGGTATAGAGGTATAGAGGTATAGAGGAATAGAGGSATAGAGGAATAGAGGSATAGAGGSATAGAGGSATAGAGGSAGSGKAGSAGAVGGNAGGDTAPASEDDGCGCRVAGAARPGDAAAGLGLLAVGLAWLRRRRGGNRQDS